MNTFSVNLTIENEQSLPSLYGDMDKNLRLIENTYGVILHARGNRIQIEGDEKTVSKVEHLIRQLADMLAQGIIVQKDDVKDAIQAFSSNSSSTLKDIFQKTIPVSSRKRPVTPKNETQRGGISSPSEKTTSCSASVRVAPARPIWPWPRRCPRSCGAR